MESRFFFLIFKACYCIPIKGTKDDSKFNGVHVGCETEGGGGGGVGENKKREDHLEIMELGQNYSYT